MKTIYKYNLDLPYSLHDFHISKIHVENNNLHLIFENGFLKTLEPYPQVNGDILIQNIDLDFCFVYILKEATYQKMELSEFINKYPNYSFEIIDELYGYNQIQYNGYLSLPNDTHLYEMMISVYYLGNIIYETVE